MKKLGWYVVSAAVAAFILGAMFLLAANLYVQSRVVQQRIRLALGNALHMPVSLKKTTFTPWDGLRIDGITAHPASEDITEVNETTANDLNVGSFRVYFALGPLLQRHFVVEDVLLDRPELRWTQDANNRWRLPSARSPKDEHAAPEQTPPVNKGSLPEAPLATPTPVPSALPLAPTPPEVVEQAAPTPVRPRGLGVTVDKFRLRHGSMDFFNHRRGLLGRFDEVDVDGHLENHNQRASGEATVARVWLPRAGLKLAQFHSDFVYTPDGDLDLRDAQAALAGGQLSADYHMRTTEDGTPFTVKCALQNVGISQLIKDAGRKHPFVDGKLQGTLAASGVTNALEECHASGHIQLNDTQIHDFPLIQAVGEALRIDDLRHLRFKTAQLDYRLDGLTLEIKPLLLASDNVRITAEGHYQLRTDRLDLHARLFVDALVARQLPRFVDQKFTPCGDEAPGSKYIDFKINGPINRLTSNLYQRLMPDSLEGLLDNFLRPHPKRAKQKPPEMDDEPSPPTDDLTPTPENSTDPTPATEDTPSPDDT